MDITIIFNSLMSQLKLIKENINNHDIDTCLNFCLMFRSNDINLYMQYVNVENDKTIYGDKKIKAFIDLVCKILGLEQVLGNEKIIFDFIIKNIIEEGYVYHLTPSCNVFNIKANGMNVNSRTESDVMEFARKLGEEAKIYFFPLGIEDKEFWYYSLTPNASKLYGSCPEWFYLMTDSLFIEKGEYSIDQVVDNVLSIMKIYNESLENQKEMETLLRKYWSMYFESHRVMVLVPLLEITTEVKGISKRFPSFKDEQELIMALNFIINKFLGNGINEKTDKIIEPSKLKFLDLKSLEFETEQKLTF